MEVDGEPEVPVHVPSKIRFQSDVQDTPQDLECQFASPSNCEIDLGLLSEGNYYEARFFMSHKLGQSVEVPSIQTPEVIVTDLKKYEGRRGHRVTLEVKCGEKGFMNEQIVFENDTSEKVTLNVLAKIMSTQSGKPALKGGIKVLHRCIDGISDADTDWQGFDHLEES